MPSNSESARKCNRNRSIRRHRKAPGQIGSQGMPSFNVENAESWVVAACAAIAAIYAIINGPMRERGWRKTTELELRLAELFEAGTPTPHDKRTARLLRDRAAERVHSAYTRPGVVVSTVKRALESLINVSIIAFALSTTGAIISIWTGIWRPWSMIAFAASGLSTAVSCLLYMMFVSWSSKRLQTKYSRKKDVTSSEHEQKI